MDRENDIKYLCAGVALVLRAEGGALHIHDERILCVRVLMSLFSCLSSGLLMLLLMDDDRRVQSLFDVGSIGVVWEF